MAKIWVRRGGVTGIRKAALGGKPANVGGGERSGFNGPFFNPGMPMRPQAPSSAGRAFDFPTGVNLTYQPRQQQGLRNVSFELLRRLADPAQGGLDLLRVAIEKRKRAMRLQEFHIIGRDGKDETARGRDAMQILRKPDGFQPWRNWIGQLLEDHFVIDAPTVYFRPSGDNVLLELIDGATITLLLDDNGRTPMPPRDAYEQVIKGVVASSYTVEELGYYVDNPRPGRIYGMSPVEQLVTLVTIALNRQLSVLNYFTAGSIPDMLIGVPDQWNPDQISQYQEWWDSFLSGQLDERRHARFIPGQTKPYETKGEILKNEFDEWLSRMICFCMDLSPESLVKQTNRATAETAKESAAEQGVESSKLYVKYVVDDILDRLGGGDLEMQWQDEEIVDPLIKAKVAVMLRGGETGGAKPVITLDEQRVMMGLKPATPEQMAELEPPEPDPETQPSGGGTNAPADAPPTDAGTTKQAAASRGGRSLPAVPANRKARRKAEAGINRLVKSHLARQKKALLAKVDTLSKAMSEEIAGLLAELRRTPWDETVIGKLRELLQTLSQARAQDTLDHLADIIGGTDDAFAALLTQANEDAVEWARDRAGNLVTGIDDASQKFLNEITSSAIEDGLSNDQLATLIEDAYGFSPERSMVIARTETAEADGAGKLIGYRQSGVVTGKGWDPDAEACPICLENADAGVIPLDDTFPSGDDHEPAHPSCECSVYPAVDED